MLDSIHVGVTGLLGYQRGLRVIANNTANLNTPGYKESTLQFADLFYANTPGAAGQQVQLGQGLDTRGTRLDFRQGDLRDTGNEFDLGLQGEGMFIVRDGQGQTRYTRAGQFHFDAEGVFVNADGSRVLGTDAAGGLGEISVAGLRTAAGKPTTTVRLTGNISSTSTEQTVGAVRVFDAGGAEHTLSVKFTSLAPGQAGHWRVELMDGATLVGSSEIAFVDGRPSAQTASLSFNYTPAGGSAQPLTLDFSSDVTSFASGNLSTLAMSSQDGKGPGTLTRVAFDASGTLVASYSNGDTARGARIALARFTTPDAVQELGGNYFGEANGIEWARGAAGEPGFGTLRAGALEGSNVDLSREFSDLVVMQRGYQASSQIVSTANDMMQELFGMKNK